MNKFILSVSALICASHAIAADIYKDDKYSVGIGGRVHAMSDQYSGHSVSSGYTRFNIKGTSVVNDNLKAFAFFEKQFDFNGIDTNRDMYAGIATMYGDIFTGRFGSALEQITDFTDIMMTAGAKASRKIDEEREAGAFVYRINKYDFNFMAKYKKQDYNYDDRKNEVNGSTSTSVVYNGIPGIKLGIGYADTKYEKQIESVLSYTWNNFYIAGLLNKYDYAITEKEYKSTGYEIATSYKFGDFKFVYTYNNLDSKVVNASMGGLLKEDPNKENHAFETVYSFDEHLNVFAGIDKDMIESRDYTHYIIGARYDF